MKSKFLKRMLQAMVAGIVLMAIGFFMTPKSFRDQLRQWEDSEWDHLNPGVSLRTESFSYDLMEGNISKLEVFVPSEDVKIIPTDGKVLKGEWVSGSYMTLRHERTGDTLKIKSDNERKWVFSFFDWAGDRQLKLFVPKDLLLDLDIETVSGDVFIDWGEGKNVKIQTTSGKVEGKWNRAESLIASTTSGSIIAEIETGSVEAELTSLSGDLELHADIIEALNVETTSGEIDIRAKDVKTTSGRLYSLSGDIQVQGVSKETGVDVRTLSGQLSLWNMSVGKNFSQPGNGNLSAETTSGDITFK